MVIEIFFFASSFIIFLIGIINYFKHKKMIFENEKHIGDYKMQYYEQ